VFANAPNPVDTPDTGRPRGGQFVNGGSALAQHLPERLGNLDASMLASDRHDVAEADNVAAQVD
jgi:hypothetical protein